MQGGFAFLEAGSVRSKNTTNILIKNLLDACKYSMDVVFDWIVAGVFYWLFGYAFAYGSPGNAFIGYGYFAHYELPTSSYSSWIFQYVFAATAATIVSGAVAERCDFTAYLVYSSVITGFIFPVVSHWAWDSKGWLAKGITYEDGNNTITVTYADFAGSGAVHMLGGIAAFCAAAVMGPRIGRFNKETGLPEDIKGHSVPLAALGAFILLFGFFAFNGSSQASIASEGDGIAVAIAIKNTIVAGSAGAFTTMLMNKSKWFGDKKWSFLSTLNGCLTGMLFCNGGMKASVPLFIKATHILQVSVCAGCNQIETYGAFVMGLIGGVVYMITTWMVIKFKVDDPLDATAVHYGGGIWGAIAVAFFSNDGGVFYSWDKRSALFLAWQLAGIAAIAAWTIGTCLPMFFILKKLRILRVSFEYEMKGLDIPKHGEPAYPLESYGHGWGEKGDSLSSMVSSSIRTSTAAITKDSIT
ncbi:hypothetical protein KUTeg_023434 [Tegillarca granosa]|uniref:Ammonium transporter AmtB-like domain-containing protein n=1 Tax=Tegillarca granosa TaxID=220873 RepID=A0ABQ9E1N0_TEGGR|nr:hypothetical protein KUTeg_023434 [Tegillarca granosa]